jgi:hypothetical protein
MAKRLLVVLCMLLILQAQAQDDATRSVFVEVGGPSLVYSFNYDFRFEENLDAWGMRVGAGGFKVNDESLFTLPVQVTRILGKDKNYFEVGAGFTFINYSSTFTVYTDPYDPNNVRQVTNKDYDFILDIGRTPSLLGTLNIGYRRIPEDGGFTYRINVTPLFTTKGFWPLFAGVGLGYAF